jgi:hypothetical protein
MQSSWTHFQCARDFNELRGRFGGQNLAEERADLGRICGDEY